MLSKSQRWSLKDKLFRRAAFLIDQLPYFERRLNSLNDKMDELIERKEFYNEWSPTQLQNVYVGTLRFYNECVVLSREILALMIEDERERRLAEGIKIEPETDEQKEVDAAVK